MRLSKSEAYIYIIYIHQQAVNRCSGNFSIYRDRESCAMTTFFLPNLTSNSNHSHTFVEEKEGLKLK